MWKNFGKSTVALIFGRLKGERLMRENRLSGDSVKFLFSLLLTTGVTSGRV